MKAKHIAGLVLLAMILITGSSLSQGLTPIEDLGKALFFDTNLSTPPGQSCAACHGPDVGYTGPDSEINNGQVAYAGAVHVRGGNRKPPTAAYGGFSPVMYYDEDEELFIGGMFWDGRATGWIGLADISQIRADTATRQRIAQIARNRRRTEMEVSRYVRKLRANADIKRFLNE